MRRRLFNILSAVSLLLCVATMVARLGVWLIEMADFGDSDRVQWLHPYSSVVLLLTAILPCCWLWLYRRQMTGRLFNILSALSLLLCITAMVALLGVWLIEMADSDSVQWLHPYCVVVLLTAILPCRWLWLNRSQMKHRFTVLSAMSLLLCLATAALWILSIWVVPTCYHGGEDGGPYSFVYSAHGCIGWEWLASRDTFTNSQFFVWHADAWGTGYRWENLGFDWYSRSTQLEFLIPDWFICSITGILPCLWYRSYRQRRLAERKGLCPKCGYDLRTSKERCPECGTPVIVTEVPPSHTKVVRKGMKRRLFNILSAVSLLLCVATMAVGIRSIWVVTEWERYCDEGGGSTVLAESADGRIAVTYEPVSGGGDPPAIGFREFGKDDSSTFLWNHLGFYLQIIDPSGEGWEFIIPDWFICSVTAVLPYLWYRSYRRQRLRILKGLCLKCGYDLRASKDRCPECGTPIIATESKV